MSPPPQPPQPPPIKQIKFVSNDGLPHSKRRRIKSACRTCQKRKTRCSGEEPVCETCRQNNHICMGYNKKGNQGAKPQKQETEDENWEGDTLPPKSTDPPSPTGSNSQARPNRQRHSSQPIVLPSHQDGPVTGATEHAGENAIEDVHSKRKFNETSDPFAPQQPTSPARSRRNSDPTGPFFLAERKALRMPYFRYFGPTAVVPGYRRVVVEVRNQKPPRSGSASASTCSSLPSPAVSHAGLTGSCTSGNATSENPPTDEDLPSYDPTGFTPNHPLIIHLVETFFENLGCSFPFLQRDSLIRDVEWKRADAVLVDAVCAVAARFSNHPLLAGERRKSARGVVFASRAAVLVVEAFACPSLAAVQACLLLAYAEFGNGKDSSLWMFLGCAIRMSQDLGLHRREGMHGVHECSATLAREPVRPGSSGELTLGAHHISGQPPGENATSASGGDHDEKTDAQKLNDRRNTFWCIYFLDRVLSSGTGRPVTLKDEEIEMEMPPQDPDDPMPIPAIIRMIKLYGRTTDIVNKIKMSSEGSSADMWQELQQRAGELEAMYEHLPKRLHLNVENAQYYQACGQSVAFIILHVWLHALYILIYHPTVATGSAMPETYRSYDDIAFSNAKSIADLASYIHDHDKNGLVGNPFNSQPMYLAACTFLEIAYPNGKPESSSFTGADQAPLPLPARLARTGRQQLRTMDTATDSRPDFQTREHFLMTAAKHYDDCYQAISHLESYWKGVGYLALVLDQKKEGISNPSLFTTEEKENALRAQAWDPKTWSLAKSLRRPSHGKFGEETEVRGDASITQGRSPSEEPTFTGDISQASAWSFAGVAGGPTSEVTFFYNQREFAPNQLQVPNPGFTLPSQPMVEPQHQPHSRTSFHTGANNMGTTVTTAEAENMLMSDMSGQPPPPPHDRAAEFAPVVPTTVPAMVPSHNHYQTSFPPGQYAPFHYGNGNQNQRNRGFLTESGQVELNALGLDLNQIYVFQGDQIY